MTTMEQTAREARTELGGALRYSYAAPEDSGVARWRDVSRSGASIELGRYLRPGREVMLEVSSPLVLNGPLKIRGRVVWCRPAAEAGRYVAGLFIYRDTPEMALDFAALGYAARRQSNTQDVNEVSKGPLWTLFSPRTETGTYNGLAQARAV